ncbi:hypothetical protein PAHAL_4G225400 [Panicum hallii]|uniref:Uncharacterized protein n=1 Tax=Panicum hallii TaxID=206008 RepID=A0A2S3HK37_9POAL|nr:hypothetical protein PAHAL_4G225400 [Panicum hallii]
MRPLCRHVVAVRPARAVIARGRHPHQRLPSAGTMLINKYLRSKSPAGGGRDKMTPTSDWASCDRDPYLCLPSCMPVRAKRGPRRHHPGRGVPEPPCHPRRRRRWRRPLRGSRPSSASRTSP